MDGTTGPSILVPSLQGQPSSEDSSLDLGLESIGSVGSMGSLADCAPGMLGAVGCGELCEEPAALARLILSLPLAQIIAPSSRTRFMFSCLDAGLAPRANVIIRRLNTTQVNLSHQGMGNKLGAAFAACLKDLPLVRELNLRDNRLTDDSLLPLVEAIRHRTDLYSLDLSENKLDGASCTQMAEYFTDQGNNLRKFVLSRADINDSEAANFIAQMRKNSSLTHLDLSHNLIGSQESLNYVQPSFYTGAEALADWLATPRCSLKYLDVSWNTIRLDSGVQLCHALKECQCLETLNMSYNGLGSKGGEAIGDSLRVNTALRDLNIERNSITPRACFTISEGLIANEGLRKVEMGKNPLGQIGLRCVMRLPQELRNTLEVNVRGSNFQVGDSTCWFDEERLRSHYTFNLTEPYDMACASNLFRKAAREDGLILHKVEHSSSSGTETLNIVRGSPPAEPTDDMLHKDPSLVFRTYDTNGSGDMNEAELKAALTDMGLNAEHESAVILQRYDTDGNGSIEEEEFVAFVTNKLAEGKVQAERICRFIALEESPHEAWKIPLEGTLSVELGYERLANQGLATTSEHTKAMLGILDTLGEGSGGIMGQALDSVSLDSEQGRVMYATVLKECGGDKIKALEKVLPRMANASEARMLVTMKLPDLQDRRKLKRELGPAYDPIMGRTMGHYKLDLCKATHQLALKKLMEVSNNEKAAMMRSKYQFDTSQSGNWENIRNEVYNGKPIKFKPARWTSPPSYGLLEFDYVSTHRPQRGVTAMSHKRYMQMLAQLGFVDSDTLRALSRPGGEKVIQAAIEEATRYSPGSTFSEELHYLYTKETPPPLRTARSSAASRSSVAQQPKRSLGNATRGRSVADPSQSSSTKSSTSPRGNSKTPLQAAASAAADSAEKLKAPPMRITLKSNKPLLERKLEAESDSTSTLSVISVLQSLDEGGASASLGVAGSEQRRANTWHRIEEYLSDRWYSCEQAHYIIIRAQETWKVDEDREEVQRLLIELVVRIFPHIIDLRGYLRLVEHFNERLQAKIYKRVGWLNMFNPMDADRTYELSLSRREERQVAKMMIHLAMIEPGENWVNESFRWHRYESCIPGWELGKAWLDEDGVPTRGVLTLTYFSGDGKMINGCKAHDDLRVALSHALVLPEPSWEDLEEHLPGVEVTRDYINSLMPIAGLDFYYGPRPS
ncbi:unnamed protein product [Chrysoparadoxa australica]